MPLGVALRLTRLWYDLDANWGNYCELELIARRFLMKNAISYSPAPGQVVLALTAGEHGWTVSIKAEGGAKCPECGARSGSHHSSYFRVLHDLPIQGEAVKVRARILRWRCRNAQCSRQIFAERIPELAAPFARRTARVASIVQLFGHTAGGRPSERLLSRLGMTAGRNAVLRAVKNGARSQSVSTSLRVAGIDDWAWQKGSTYGTVIVDLERHHVVDLLSDRSADATAKWLAGHPEVEVVVRDRAGLYAEGARRGAPQAYQVADRFHLLQNFRETVERQLSRLEAPIRATQLQNKNEGPFCEAPSTSEIPRPIIAAEHDRIARRVRTAERQAVFDQVRALYDTGHTATEIALKLGLGRRRTMRWVRLIVLPERAAMLAKSSTPEQYGTFLAKRWGEGVTNGQHLLLEVRRYGYTGSFSHLARFLSPWRHPVTSAQEMQDRFQSSCATPLDPNTGRRISPLIAASLCVKPRDQMTPQQIVNVDTMEAQSIEFTRMRKLAMRFRGLLRGGTVEALDTWLLDARSSGIHGMRRFAITIRQDIEAVRNAVLQRGSNGQTEGQINRLKTIKRSMYGRASVELLRARMMPLNGVS
jgi:transposase